MALVTLIVTQYRYLWGTELPFSGSWGGAWIPIVRFVGAMMLIAAVVASIMSLGSAALQFLHENQSNSAVALWTIAVHIVLIDLIFVLGWALGYPLLFWWRNSQARPDRLKQQHGDDLFPPSPPTPGASEPAPN